MDSNDFDSEPTPSPSEGLNFTGLYDKETEMGDSAAHEEDDIKKKTRAPVIICIVCAIICLIATALVLLVLPGKFNLRQKMAEKKAKTAVEKPAETPATTVPVEEKKPDPVPQAKEDEVVVIEKAEDVKPVPPPAAETKNKNVTYKIKWGDTLWDIADTYYKNPWRYKKIANYNGIKNPDHIISGTIITIPAE
ncbi:MAG: LysM peptidoglycan-binding domain-containing protein [Treponema sp.]|nr:LysM peptidoglycan-binding domain-containing protein [Treponema sp.]MBR5032166.1 LysM peptidoglycan-binding domain-containing protein [Treponema sp.]